MDNLEDRRQRENLWCLVSLVWTYCTLLVVYFHNGDLNVCSFIADCELNAEAIVNVDYQGNYFPSSCSIFDSFVDPFVGETSLQETSKKPKIES